MMMKERTEEEEVLVLVLVLRVVMDSRGTPGSRDQGRHHPVPPAPTVRGRMGGKGAKEPIPYPHPHNNPVSHTHSQPITHNLVS